MRKFLLSLSLSLASLTLVGSSAIATPKRPPLQSSQQPQAAKSVTGTVVSIGNDGKSFALETTTGANKQTLQFVLDQQTKVNGQVHVGTAVQVQYVAMQDQNVATIITAQG